MAIISKDYINVQNIVSEINKWGENIDVDIADAALGQVVWPIKAITQLYLFLDSPIQLFVKSTSANDTLLGTGAQGVAGSYHDDNGNMASFDLDMAGIVNVPLPTTSYGAFRFSVETSGASNTNEGQLQIVDGSGNIYAVILIGEGQTQIAVQRIPNNRKGNIIYHKVDYARVGGASGNAEMRLKVRKVDGTIITKWDPTITSLNPEDVKVYSQFGGIAVNPGEWVYWECISVSANATPLRGAFDIQLEGSE